MTTVRSVELVARERTALDDRFDKGFVEIVKMYENFSSDTPPQEPDVRHALREPGTRDALKKEVVGHFLVSAE